MKKVVLIACCSKKLNVRSKAKDMYISSLFKYSYKYASQLKPNYIFILSAKYGLLNPNDEIDPYNETLNNKSKKEIMLWADVVIKELSKHVNLNEDKLIFLAGNNYRQYLIDHINHYEVPMLGLGIGKQLKYLKQKTGWGK